MLCFRTYFLGVRAATALHYKRWRAARSWARAVCSRLGLLGLGRFRLLGRLRGGLRCLGLLGGRGFLGRLDGLLDGLLGGLLLRGLGDWLGGLGLLGGLGGFLGLGGLRGGLCV